MATLLCRLSRVCLCALSVQTYQNLGSSCYNWKPSKSWYPTRSAPSTYRTTKSIFVAYLLLFFFFLFFFFLKMRLVSYLVYTLSCVVYFITVITRVKKVRLGKTVCCWKLWREKAHAKGKHLFSGSKYIRNNLCFALFIQQISLYFNAFLHICSWINLHRKRYKAVKLQSTAFNLLYYPCTVDSRYLEVQATLWNTSRYPYFDISDLRHWGKQ